ncbi:MAG TPA: hypothetical protein VN426_06420 [Syntrophomonadaceae bacterium]|nr:hypothetical protein [Syntrophomonadaceae bacterium]
MEKYDLRDSYRDAVEPGEDCKKDPKTKCCPRFLLLPEKYTGVPTDPTGRFARKYDVDPEEIFEDALAYAALHRRDPLKLQIFMLAPRPEKIGFKGWKYEGWLVDVKPPKRNEAGDCSDNGEEHGFMERPLSIGFFKDIGLTAPNGLGIFINKFISKGSVRPYDSVAVTFEPPEKEKGKKHHDHHGHILVIPLTGKIPGKFKKEY